MKKLISLFLLLAMLTALLVACKPADGTPEESSTQAPHNAVKFKDIDLSKIVNFDLVTVSETPTDYVLLDVAGYGKILMRLYADVAPETVANFKALVASGFYDGLIFHRVIKDFMIQGGDPKGDGTGGSPDNIKGEFSSNGFENNLKHLRGVVSMARLGNDMNSASSQFFICHQNFETGNGNYAAFGYVVHGMDVVDKIANVQTDANDKPKTNVVITSAKFATVPTEAMRDPLDLLEVSSTPTDYVLIDVADYGKFLIRLYPDEAPETVANFKSLVANGFYDGLTFHSVVRNFIIQGGDPKGDGTGGSGTTIPGEFSANGVTNRISHVRGVVSMMRLKDDMNSASSQFFICHKDATTDFDGNYAAFGYVIACMETVDSITNVSVDIKNKPKTTVRIQSAKFVVVAPDAYNDPIADTLNPTM